MKYLIFSILAISLISFNFLSFGQQKTVQNQDSTYIKFSGLWQLINTNFFSILNIKGNYFVNINIDDNKFEGELKNDVIKFPLGEIIYLPKENQLLLKITKEFKGLEKIATREFVYQKTSTPVIIDYPIYGKWELQEIKKLYTKEFKTKDSASYNKWFNTLKGTYYALELLRYNKHKSYQYIENDNYKWESWDIGDFHYMPITQSFLFDDKKDDEFQHKYNGKIDYYHCGSGVFHCHPSYLEPWHLPYRCIVSSDTLTFFMNYDGPDYCWIFKKVKDFKYLKITERFYSSGEIKNKGKYISGYQEGYWEYFYKSGNKKSTGNYRMGKKEGLWIEYFDTINLIKNEINYKNDLENGKSTFYNIDGTKESEINYINGEIEGDKILYRNGKAIKEQEFIYSENKKKWESLLAKIPPIQKTTPYKKVTWKCKTGYSPTYEKIYDKEGRILQKTEDGTTHYLYTENKTITIEILCFNNQIIASLLFFNAKNKLDSMYIFNNYKSNKSIPNMLNIKLDSLFYQLEFDHKLIFFQKEITDDNSISTITNVYPYNSEIVEQLYDSHGNPLRDFQRFAHSYVENKFVYDIKGRIYKKYFNDGGYGCGCNSMPGRYCLSIYNYDDEDNIIKETIIMSKDGHFEYKNNKDDIIFKYQTTLIGN